MPRPVSSLAPEGFEWLGVPETSRALKIQNEADRQFLAIEQQHDRIVTGCRQIHATGITETFREDRV